MNKVIYCMIVALALTSCEKELGQLTDFEASCLVVNALITAQADGQSLRIRQTGLTQVQHVRDAEIHLSVNDQPLMHFMTNGEESIPVPTKDLNPGDVVSIDVQKETLHASASAIVPQPVLIDGIDTLTVKAKRYRYSQEYEPHTRYLIHLQLPDETSDETRFFRVAIEKRVVTPKSWDATDGIVTHVTYQEDSDHTLFGYWGDPALCENENVDQENMSVSFDWLDGMQNVYHLFRSNYFDEGRYTLRLDLPYPVGGTSHGWAQQVCIRVYSISQMEYNYLQSLTAIKTLDLGTIYDSEPGVTTNVAGGAGIFCISSVAEASLYEDHHLLKASDL